MNVIRKILRLGRGSLIDAANGSVYSAYDVTRAIAGWRDLLPDSGARVVVLTDGSALAGVAYLAAIGAGLTVIPLDRRRIDELESVVDEARAEWVWASHTHSKTMDSGRWIIGESILADRALAPVPVPANALASLMLTSGSTGSPKLVCVSHDNLAANTDGIIESQSLGENERAYLTLPIAYCFGASVLQTHLAVGGDVVFDSRMWIAERAIRTIEGYACTTLCGVPVTYELLAASGRLSPERMPTLRRMISSGGTLGRSVFENIRSALPYASFHAMYGQTEATARITTHIGDPGPLSVGSVGTPVRHVELRIHGPDPRSGIGEVVLSGRSVTLGYWADPEGTAERFRDGELWTGDLGRLDASHRLWLVGRRSEFAKFRGFRVGYGEIDAAITAWGEVLEGACAASAISPDRVDVFVVLNTPAQPGWESRLRASLPQSWSIGAVRVVASIPRTVNGKVDRPALGKLLPPRRSAARRGTAQALRDTHPSLPSVRRRPDLHRARNSDRSDALKVQPKH